MPASSLESDLRAAREAAGVSVEQIQQETRIPADVIQRFEAGKLLGDPAFNEVYLKAFLRAYAGAVGLPPNRVVDAYAAYRAGTYRGELHPDAPETPPEPAPVPAPPAVAEPPRTAAEAPSPAREAPVPPPTERAPAVAALSHAPEPDVPVRPTAAPNEHFPKRRVMPAATAAAPRSFDRSWGTILGVTAAVVLAVAAVLWLLFRDTSPQPEAEDVAAVTDSTVADTTASDTTAAATPAQTAGPALALPIRVTVVAGGDGLQEFRATEIPQDRRPYWVEPGDELALESNEGVILWGEHAGGLDPAEVTLRWQGFQWNPPQGQILRITPQNGQRLLDSLQTAGARRTP